MGDWLVDPVTNSISNNHHSKEVIPKLMETLCFFADNHEQVVSAELIVKAIWKKSVVGDNSLYNNIAQLRKLLEDTAPKKYYIETIPKKGYRLIAPLREYQDYSPADEVAISTVPNYLKQDSNTVNKNRSSLYIAVVTTVLLSVVAMLYLSEFNRSKEDATASISTIAVLL